MKSNNNWLPNFIFNLIYEFNLPTLNLSIDYFCLQQARPHSLNVNFRWRSCQQNGLACKWNLRPSSVWATSWIVRGWFQRIFFNWKLCKSSTTSRRYHEKQNYLNLTTNRFNREKRSDFDWQLDLFSNFERGSPATSVFSEG